MKEIKRILVACRMHEPCRKVIRYGVSLARTCEAELYVIHVVYDPFIRGDWNLPIPLGTLEEEYKRILAKSGKNIEAILLEEKSKGVAVKEIIREGKPTDEILKVIREENIDLLLMLSHAEGRLEHLLFGRSNEDITRQMPCSVLLVKLEHEQVSF